MISGLWPFSKNQNNASLDLERPLSRDDLRPLCEALRKTQSHPATNRILRGTAINVCGSLPDTYRYDPFKFHLLYSFKKKTYEVEKIEFNPFLSGNGKQNTPSGDDVFHSMILRKYPLDHFVDGTVIYLKGECIPNERFPLWREIRLLAQAEWDYVFAQVNTHGLPKRGLASFGMESQIPIDYYENTEKITQTSSRERIYTPSILSQNLKTAELIKLLKERRDGKLIARALEEISTQLSDILSHSHERSDDSPSLSKFAQELNENILSELLAPYLALAPGRGGSTLLDNGDTAERAILAQLEVISQKIANWQFPRQIAQIENNHKLLEVLLMRD